MTDPAGSSCYLAILWPLNKNMLSQRKYVIFFYFTFEYMNTELFSSILPVFFLSVRDPEQAPEGQLITDPPYLDPETLNERGL